MASYYWIKLYHEILDDPKMGRLPDHLWRRVVELFLMAGEQQQEGLLPSVADMSWRLRCTEDGLLSDLRELEKPNRAIVEHREAGWIVTNFAERQAPVSNAERQQRYRSRQRKETPIVSGSNATSNESLQKPVIDTDTDTDTDKIKDAATAAATPSAKDKDNGRPPPSESKPATEHQAMFTALAEAYRIDARSGVMTTKQRGRLNTMSKRLRKGSYGVDEVVAAGQHWWREDWRGKKGDMPTDSQFLETLSKRRTQTTDQSPRRAEW